MVNTQGFEVPNPGSFFESYLWCLKFLLEGFNTWDLDYQWYHTVADLPLQNKEEDSFFKLSKHTNVKTH